MDLAKVLSDGPRSPGDVAAGLALAGSGALALLQDVSGNLPPGTGSSLISIIATALATGGVGYLVVRTLMAEVSKRWDAQREEARAEREEEKAERERTHQYWAGLVADRNQANADLMQRYIEREQCIDAQRAEQQAAITQQMLEQITAWRQACEAERGRNDTLVLQFISKVHLVHEGEPGAG